MTIELIDFSCPRCLTDVHEEFYGPCGTCRTNLAVKLAREARTVEVAAFAPKMNVVPNAVATARDE